MEGLQAAGVKSQHLIVVKTFHNKSHVRRRHTVRMNKTVSGLLYHCPCITLSFWLKESACGFFSQLITLFVTEVAVIGNCIAFHCH